MLELYTLILPVGTPAVWDCKNKESRFLDVYRTIQCFAGRAPVHLCSQKGLEHALVVSGGSLRGKSVRMGRHYSALAGLTFGHVVGPLQRLLDRKSFSVQDLKEPHMHLKPLKIWLSHRLNHPGSYRGGT